MSIGTKKEWANPLQNLNAFKMYLERTFKCYLNHNKNAFNTSI